MNREKQFIVVYRSRNFEVINWEEYLYGDFDELLEVVWGLVRE